MAKYTYISQENPDKNISQQLAYEYKCFPSFGTKVRGFNPGRSCQIFQGEKNPQHAFLGWEVKACPMSQI
jgi:hypothetical protein